MVVIVIGRLAVGRLWWSVGYLLCKGDNRNISLLCPLQSTDNT